MRIRSFAPVVLALSATLAVAACGDDAGSADASPSAAPSSAPESASSEAPSNAAIETPDFSGSITVSAAASLTGSFTTIGDDFTAAYPGTEVVFTFDSSSTLAQQIIDGAPADVFASADEANMVKLTDPGLIAGDPVVIATNQLVIVTKPGNPAGVTGLADLPSVGVVSLCGEEVPCGRFAKQILDGAGVAIPETSVTRGQNVKATLTAVAEGDAVAGIVYVTDAIAAADTVTAVDIPADQNAVATYPIGVVGASANAGLAQAFVDYVAGYDGQLALKEAGFGPPA